MRYQGYHAPLPPQTEARLAARAEAAQLGPRVTERDGRLYLELPSPGVVHEYVAELTRWGFRWQDPWWVKVIPAEKQEAGLKWAWELFYEYFPHYDPEVLEEGKRLRQELLQPIISPVRFCEKCGRETAHAFGLGCAGCRKRNQSEE